MFTMATLFLTTIIGGGDDHFLGNRGQNNPVGRYKYNAGY